MRRKKGMDRGEIIESFADLKDFKNIDRVSMMRILEEVFRDMIIKQYETDENFDVIINAEKGDVEIWRNREIVSDEEYSDPIKEVKFSDAIKIEPDFEIGEEISEEVKIYEFKRRIIQSAKISLVNKIQFLEKEEVLKKYDDRVGEIVVGEVYQIWKRELLVLDDDGNELILPKHQMLKSDVYRKGDIIKGVILSVEHRGYTALITMSRASNEFLARLFEIEIPEISDGLITIRKIVREPGERAKVAVESYDDRIDPVGACVGMKGSRIYSIIKELKNESIDVINYTDNLELYIARSLSPAKTSSITVNKEKKRVSVYLKQDQVSLAIGKGGLNIKLAAKLVDYEIDVFREVEEGDYDVELGEFADEVDEWVIAELRKIGCDTAKSVLDLSSEELLRRTDLEEETIEDLFTILKSEFE